MRYDHANTTSIAVASFALAAHGPCREAGSCLVSSATHHGDDQYIDATWLRWVAFNQVANLPNPTRGWLCTARLGPCARNSDSGSSEIESLMQTAIFCSSKGGTPAVLPPPPGAGHSGSPVAETSTEGEQRFASRNTQGSTLRRLGVMQGTLTPINSTDHHIYFSKLLETCISRRPLSPFKQILGD